MNGRKVKKEEGYEKFLFIYLSKFEIEEGIS
jgi:hypothetical protein